MITDERQRRAAKAQVRRLEEALRGQKTSDKRLDPRLRSAARESILSQLGELQGELAEYDRLKASTVDDLELASLDDLPLLLIKARIVRGYTQEDLARRLRIKEAQIRKYEATSYRSARLEQVLEIAKALRIELREPVKLRQTGVRPEP